LVAGDCAMLRDEASSRKDKGAARRLSMRKDLRFAFYTSAESR
jgi:hypothetical protein